MKTTVEQRQAWLNKADELGYIDVDPIPLIADVEELLAIIARDHRADMKPDECYCQACTQHREVEKVSE